MLDTPKGEENPTLAVARSSLVNEDANTVLSGVDSPHWPMIEANGRPRPFLQSAAGRNLHRVLITDAHYKHAIALTRFIRKELPGVHLTGHSRRTVRVAKCYGCFDAFVTGEPLRDTLFKRSFDQVIPVGGRSVVEVAEMCPDLAVLPPMKRLVSCYDKRATIELANRLGIPAPRTQALTKLEELAEDQLSFPCVVKPAHELASAKDVRYCANTTETRQAVGAMLKALENDGVGVLVQDFIDGPGHGFFALLDHGKPLRIFMHQRLREYPPSGGISTAAAAFYSSRLEDLGLRLLSALEWHGAAMVEFKYDRHRKDFFLMEINGKLWGSLELALQAGVNFGADLIRIYRDEPITFSAAYDRDVRFYWPLDGDLKTLRRTRRLIAGIRDYFRPGAATNLGQSKRADAMKSLLLIWELMHANHS